jgi:hypothetical protein
VPGRRGTLDLLTEQLKLVYFLGSDAHFQIGIILQKRADSFFDELIGCCAPGSGKPVEGAFLPCG